ncbi:MAG: gliding motility-associated C-terminal domain-containing protein [Bacteroidota bacterium]
MKNNLRLLAFLAFLLLINADVLATHNRAGEIVIEQVDGCTSNTIKCTLYMYTKTSSSIDRPELEVFWGDGSNELIPRVNNGGAGESLGNDVSLNIYTAFHTYDGPGRYRVSMTDPKRNGQIVNLDPPNGSDKVDFFIRTSFTLFDGQSQGCNNTPRLDNAPIGYACIGETYTHNPGAYDPDGDSLSYEMTVPLGTSGAQLPVYFFPTQIPGSSGNSTLEIDPEIGTITWDVPEFGGEYNIAFWVISWRNGIPIDTTMRDMQILVYGCDGNKAPEIQTADEICVVAGDLVAFNVIATDPNAGDQIKLSATGTPFLLDISPASNIEIWRPTGTPSAEFEDQPVAKVFRWQTACEHISDLPYTVVFRAEDDFVLGLDDAGLAFSKAVQIKVVGPPPQDVQAEAESNQINVSWEMPYACENTADEFFLSFSIWRKEGGDNYTVDECVPGLAGSGYTWLSNTSDEINGRYVFTDVDVERGRTYCYRILARFARRTGSGQPYNIVESLASDSVCLQLSREVPLITHVTVDETATTNGQIEVRWVKPLAEDLDTLNNPGPYRYELQRAAGFSNGTFETVTTIASPTYYQLTQNSFVDQNIDVNTEEEPYHYRLAFYVNNEVEPLGLAADASSVFLEIDPTDNRNDLSWSFEVPWANQQYGVFRWNGTDWDSITTVQDPFYQDTGLVNGTEYCYYIKAYGSYGLADIESPQINLSQEACAVPVDDIPPCPPTLEVFNICNRMESCDEVDALENLLQWTNPMNLCEETDDVVSYRIYFSPQEGTELEWIATVDDSGITDFSHLPERGIAGCYAVTALDTFLNESVFSNIICVDNCPNFTLPNTFTPNGDGANDFFIPYPYCFIESIELNIFNRWGELVYETNDPDINWTGENLNGKLLPAGTYYYTCKVFEQRVTGTVEAPELLSGYIDLVR